MVGNGGSAESMLGRARDRMETLRAHADARLRADWRGPGEAGRRGDEALVAALAAAGEARRRTVGHVFDDDALLAGVELCRGHVVDAVPYDADELAVIPGCLAALSGLPFHVVTVDDTSATRLAERLSERFAPLGLRTAVVTASSTAAMEPAPRRAAYAADVTVASWEQFGYDYLRDHLATSAEERVGRGQEWVFVTEADHLLLDLAAQRLIISADGPLARVPLREYLQRYMTLCGVTPVRLSDAMAEELAQTYGLGVARPEGWERPRLRARSDLSYARASGRLDGVADAVRERHTAGEAVVVAVGSARDAAPMSAALRERGVEHATATDRSPEAAAAWDRAARPGAVTVVTADAARGHRPGGVGPDGAAPSVLIAGHALFRRHDDRLCAIAAHPTAPGECEFFSCDEDPVLRLPQSRVGRFLARIDRRRGGVPVGRVMTRLVESVQGDRERAAAGQRSRRIDVEAVEREQRERIYAERDAITGDDDPLARVTEFIDITVDRHVREHTEPDALVAALVCLYPATVRAADLPAAPEDRATTLKRDALAVWRTRVEQYGEPAMREVVRQVALQCLDRSWHEHLSELDRLREHDGEASSGGTASLEEYRRAATRAFAAMRERLLDRTVELLFNVKIEVADDGPERSRPGTR